MLAGCTGRIVVGGWRVGRRSVVGAEDAIVACSMVVVGSFVASSLGSVVEVDVVLLGRSRIVAVVGRAVVSKVVGESVSSRSVGSVLRVVGLSCRGYSILVLPFLATRVLYVAVWDGTWGNRAVLCSVVLRIK